MQTVSKNLHAANKLFYGLENKNNNEALLRSQENKKNILTLILFLFFYFIKLFWQHKTSKIVPFEMLNTYILS